MSNDLRCPDCPYWWTDKGDKVGTCHYEWNDGYAPCEVQDRYEENYDDYI